MKYSEALKYIQKNPCKYVGICSNFMDTLDVTSTSPAAQWLKANIKKWQHYTGHLDYPVKGASASYNDCYAAYNHAGSTGEMFSKTTRYGRRRRALLQFLINEATAQGL